MKKFSARCAFFALALSFLAFGTLTGLAGCSDNSVEPEFIAPSQPTDVTHTQVDPTTVEITWTASTDNLVVCSYNVYRGSFLIGNTRYTSFRDTGLIPGMTYVYTVEALDCSQNASARSTPADTVITPGIPPDASSILGCAADFATLAGTTITNTGGTEITGDIGLSPGTAITGFPPGTYTGTLHINDTEANAAKLCLTTSYLYIEGQPPGATVAGNIGGQTLPPGTYTSSSTLAISSGDLTLDAGGDANAVFIFQIASDLTVTSGRQVILAGNAQADNVYWQAGSAVTLGTTSAFKGNILALDAVTLETGATLDGRVFARNGAVTLDDNAVTRP
ncbi:MAG: ice-binding family protein [Candidatus Krumholzibacteriota bacterium]|nr:ice-binding family protein [Candidatus Krumholzibacteriota bacterium]